MFAFTPMPFVDRGAGPIHLAPVLLLRSKLGEELQVLADDAHLRFVDVPAGEDIDFAGIHFKAPERAELDALSKHEIPVSIGLRLQRECADPMSLFNFLLTQVDEELCNWYALKLRELSATGLRAVIAWCNIPSLEKAAQLYELPVIHLELGPLRAPMFFPSMYVDLKGVNGNSAAVAMVEEYLHKPANIDFEHDRWIWTGHEERLIGLSRQEPQYPHGVALQVEDDSNSIAFGYGLNGVDAIYRAWQAAARTCRVLVRDHPSAHFKVRYFPFVDVDQSANSLEFVSRCAAIHTINSSVAFEAVLLGRQAFVHGDSPLLAVPTEEPSRTLALAGLFFAYLVPAALALSPQYLRWRLERPTVAEIAKAHRDFLLATPRELSTAAVEDIKPVGTSLAFDSRSVGLAWIQSLSFVRRHAQIDEQLSWLSEQRSRWEQKAQELDLQLKTTQSANAWLDEQRLAWARSADEQAQVAKNALESTGSLQAKVELLTAELNNAQSALEVTRLQVGLWGRVRGWLAQISSRSTS